MKAVIMVGGFGSRLKPLTLTVPKPLVDFADKTLIDYQIDACISAGVVEIILATNYLSEQLQEYCLQKSKEFQISFMISQETEPLGTAGPLKQAENLILSNSQNTEENKEKDTHSFFVIYGDVVCDCNLLEMYNYHKNHGKEATIMITTVEDPSKFGVVELDEFNNVVQFFEKPLEYKGNIINGGIYIFNYSILKRLSLKFQSMEREIFPIMVQEKQISAYLLKGF